MMVKQQALALIRRISVVGKGIGQGLTQTGFVPGIFGRVRSILSSPWRKFIRGLVVVIGLALFLGIQFVLATAIADAERWWFLILMSFVSLGAAVLAIRSVVLMIAIWLVLIPWTWHFPIRSAKYYFSFDLLALTLIFVIVLARLLARRIRLPSLYPAEWLLLFSIAYVNLWPILQRRIAEGAWELGTLGDIWRLVLVPSVFYFIVRTAIESERHVRLLAYTFVVIGVLWTISGFYEHYTGLQWHSALTGRPVLLQWRDVGKGRAIGPSDGQLQPGIVLSAAILMTLHVAAFTKRLVSRAIYYILAGLMTIALFFTYTRTSYAAFVLVLLVMVAIGRGRRMQYVASLAIIAGVLIAMMPTLLGVRQFFTRITDPENYFGRMAMSRTAWNIARDYFWFGAGDLRDQSLLFRYVSSWKHPGGRHGEPYYYPDNDYLVVLAERGIFGFLLYYGALFGFFVRLLRLRNELPTGSFLGTNLASTATVFSLVVFVAAGFTQLRYNPYLYYLLFTYAALVIRSRQLQTAGQAAEVESRTASIRTRLATAG